MDTVTESKMGIAMARYGGIGIIHRNMSIEQQVEEVKKVKVAEEILIREPYTLFSASSVTKARQLMYEKQIDSVLIVDGSIFPQLVGLITKYEIADADGSEMVEKYMKKRDQLIVIETENYLTGNNAKEMANCVFKEQPLLGKLPFVDKSGKLLGLMTKKDLFRYAEYPDATRDEKGRLRVGAAIGVGEKELKRAEALLQAGADVLVLDVAHGHASKPMDMARAVKVSFRNTNFDLIVGNVAAAEAVRDWARLEVAAIKIGIGPGATCSTRIVAGAGVPQVSAILECAREAEKHGIPIIADGGIRYSRDVSIAIACGASTVMIGTLLAGTDESPGDIIDDNGRLVKVVRGMSSLNVNLSIKGDDFIRAGLKDMIQPEGVTGHVPYRGPLIRVLGALVSGLRSGMTYVGAATVYDLQKPFPRKFTRMSQAAWEESKPHDV
jgi:IMP dehydrogenase